MSAVRKTYSGSAILRSNIIYPKIASDLETWLRRNGEKTSEIYVRRFLKASGKPSISYDDMVDCCLMFGWIDGVVKKDEEMSTLQRLTPRRKGSNLSELNRQRVWRLRRLNKMTRQGELALAGAKQSVGEPEDEFSIPAPLKKRLVDAGGWDFFSKDCDRFYQRLKVAWVATNPHQEETRTKHLVKQCIQRKKYGTVIDVLGSNSVPTKRRKIL